MGKAGNKICPEQNFSARWGMQSQWGTVPPSENLHSTGRAGKVGKVGEKKMWQVGSTRDCINGDKRPAQGKVEGNRTNQPKVQNQGGGGGGTGV